VDTINLIYAGENEKLMKYDQLSIEMGRNRVFEGYSEGKVNFRPTYKYNVKTDTYEKQALYNETANDLHDALNVNSNNFPAAKVKLPSWTDRVLWKVNNKTINSVQLIQYSCINTLTISDHKPVYTLFDVQVKRIDDKKFNKIYESLLKESDKRVNEEMPRISIEKFDFDFEKCMYYDIIKKELFIKNEGMSITNVDIQFYDEHMLNAINQQKSNKESELFLNKASDFHYNFHHSISSKAGQWIKINPQHLERIGPSSRNRIELTTDFNQNMLERFNKKQRIEDFLIIRCLNGNDLFATISCTYKPTIIGLSLKGLSTLNKRNSTNCASDIQAQPNEEEVGVAFENCNQKYFIETIESEVNKYEENMDSVWTAQLRHLSVEKEKLNALRMFGQSSFYTDSSDLNNNDKSNGNSQQSQISTSLPRKPSHTGSVSSYDAKISSAGSLSGAIAQQPAKDATSLTPAKLEFYTSCFRQLRKEIIENDNYFVNELSSEYKFFLNHLIKKCAKNMNFLESNNELGGKESGKASASENIGNLTIEQQKNLVLEYLSLKSFDKFDIVDFDLELMAEILYDLLNALPAPLIANRYFDYCMYTANSYENAMLILDYVPRSHATLFELIVKFLQVYMRCLNAGGSNYSNVLADAIFQVNKRKQKTMSTSSSSPSLARQISNTSDKEYFKSMTANRFLKLFVENHRSFAYL
jgi:hypothetical protein